MVFIIFCIYNNNKRCCNKRENNGRFKYKIIDSNNVQLYRDELPKCLNLSQSTIDRLIRESANGIENKYFKKLSS